MPRRIFMRLLPLRLGAQAFNDGRSKYNAGRRREESRIARRD